jgi:signal transduction histidine kinase
LGCRLHRRAIHWFTSAFFNETCMRQPDQLLPRAVTTSFAPFGTSRTSSRSRSTARELLAARTELAAANEALREAQARCARLEQSASPQALVRLAAASHDLRDPLQVIASYVELLADGLCGPVSADQRAYLERVRAHVDHLAAVVGSVLTLARVAHHGAALELSDVPVPDLLADVRTLVEPFAAAGGVSLVVDCERAPAVVRGDHTALVRVLVNLAGNAIKATPRGGRVSLSAAARAHAVELRVADSGQGIPSSQLTAIFEPFVQMHLTDGKEHGGTGLGLTIARDLTRLMGGDLLVHSVVGVGSLFTVRLPAPRAAAGAGVAVAKVA